MGYSTLGYEKAKHSVVIKQSSSSSSRDIHNNLMYISESFFEKKKIYIYIYIYIFFFLAVLGFRCCMGFSLVVASWSNSPVAMHRLLIVVASY